MKDHTCTGFCWIVGSSTSASLWSNSAPICFTAELERQAGDDERREEDRQKALPGASEGDGLAFGGLEGLSSTGVSATPNFQGVPSSFDRYLDRVIHFNRSGTVAVNFDVVRATSDLDSDCFMRHLQRCGHLGSPFTALARTFATLSQNKSKGSRLIRPVSTGISAKRRIVAGHSMLSASGSRGSRC